MSAKNNPFNFQDLLKVLYVNIKVVFAVVIFLAVFFALFFGYYSIILMAFSVLFLVYSLLEAYNNKEKSEQEETEDE